MTNIEQNKAPVSNDSNAVQASLTGGLNTVVNEINLPTGDSPYIKNLLITDSGTLKTRPGTQQLVSRETDAAGHYGISYRTRTGHDLYISKNQHDIEIFEIVTSQKDKVDSFTRLRNIEDVWPSNAGSKKLDYTITNEKNNRVVMVTEKAVPVQLTFVDKRINITSGSTIANFTLEGIEFTYATVATCTCWVNGTITVLSNVSYSSITNLCTFTFNSALPAGTYTVDLLFITWQWWGEAELLTGDQLYASTTRFNDDSTDQSVAVPTSLLFDLELFDDGMIPIIPYETSTQEDYYSFDATYDPATATEFNFSSGVVYDSAAGDKVVPGTSFVTFGALQSPTDPTEVHFIRAHKLKFNGGNGITANNLYVETDEQQSTVNLTTGSPNANPWGASFYLRNVPATESNFYSSTSVVTLATTVANYITFDATESIGLNSFQEVLLFNTDVASTYRGSGANASYSDPRKPRDARGYPIYGLAEWANYSTGSFPTAISMHDSRMVLSGFTDSPTLIVFSAIADTTVDDIFYNDFTVASRSGATVDAISFYVSVPENDAVITALTSYSGSLFAFTKDRCIRIYGGDSVLTPSSVRTNNIAAEGCVNPRCLLNVESVVYFLSKNGLYRLQPVIQVGDFTVVDVSLKVKNQLKSVKNDSVAFISYNKDFDALFVGVSTSDEILPNVSSRLYVYNIIRDAWSEFTAYYGELFISHFTTVNGIQSYSIFSVPHTNNINETDYTICSFPYFYPIDFAIEGGVDFGSGTSYSLPFNASSTNTLTTTQRIYPSSHTMNRVLNVEDVSCTINSVTKSFTEDFFKVNEDRLYIQSSFLEGQTLDVFPINDDGHFPVAVYRDNVKLTNVDDYTIDLTDSKTVSISPTGVDEAVFRFGYTYPKAWLSPTFFRNNLAEPSRLYHIYALLDNSEYQDRYEPSDVNNAVPQDAEEIVDLWKIQIGLSIFRVLETDNYNEAVSTFFNVLTDSNDLYYDIGNYDLDPTSIQTARIVKVTLPLSGVSSVFRFMFYNNSDKVFEIVAYQLIAETATRSSVTKWT